MSDGADALRGWLIAAAAQLPEPVMERTLNALTPASRRAVQEAWTVWAHPGQEVPPGNWRVWVMMAGRGFGKTRTGAEWVTRGCARTPARAIALVGGDDGRGLRLMVRGESGLERVALDEYERPVWMAARAASCDGPTGARLPLFGRGAGSAARAGTSFRVVRRTRQMAACAGRLGQSDAGAAARDRPRVVVTTTPRAGARYKDHR